MRGQEISIVLGIQPEWDQWTLSETLQRLYVMNQQGTYDRVRRHQVKPRHTHYWDDERAVWVSVKGEER